MRHHRQHRLKRLEQRRARPALRIVRTIVEPSESGPRLVALIERGTFPPSPQHNKEHHR